MSYFDDVIEPALHREPRHIRERIEREAKLDIFSVPTDSRQIPWRGNDGRKMTIGEMTDGHLENAHNLLGRRIGTQEQKETDHVFYGFLRAEINRRANQ